MMYAYRSYDANVWHICIYAARRHVHTWHMNKIRDVYIWYQWCRLGNAGRLTKQHLGQHRVLFPSPSGGCPPPPSLPPGGDGEMWVGGGGGGVRVAPTGDLPYSKHSHHCKWCKATETRLKTGTACMPPSPPPFCPSPLSRHYPVQPAMTRTHHSQLKISYYRDNEMNTRFPRKHYIYTYIYIYIYIYIYTNIHVCR